MVSFFVYLIAGIAVLALLALGYFFGWLITSYKWRQSLPLIREEAALKSRAVLKGLFTEQLAPYLPGFPYSPTEIRFIGKPVDFVVFKGMDEKNILEIAFVEVKSGKAGLSPIERQVRDVVAAKQVRFEEFRLPE
ncbi:MAG: Holliday junction resolvase-like protein [Candidatus Woesearchaeota archaeon]